MTEGDDSGIAYKDLEAHNHHDVDQSLGDHSLQVGRRERGGEREQRQPAD